MFGHNENDNPGDNPGTDNNGQGSDSDLPVPAPQNDLITPTPPAVTDQPWQGQTDTAASSEDNKDILSPAGGFPKAPSQRVHPGSTNDDASSQPDPTPPLPDDTLDAVGSDLVVIKQQALSELTPLLDELEQAPEERYRTLMMMIQASDNQAMIKAAYESAHKITDDKVRAQALLDIVNEINYFTQQPGS